MLGGYTRENIINNTTKKEGKGGGIDSPRVAPRERNDSKGGCVTQGRAPRNSRPLGKRPLITQQRRKGGA